jgi:hypothetical protein
MHLSVGTIKLNSYRPLCSTLIGINAINRHKFPPFIDGSCRREPDFQNTYPSISALCRQGQFAPHLKVNDIIIYMTVGGQFQPYKLGHHLVAILLVKKVFATHQDGQIEYLNRKLQTPSNCMVQNNLPNDFDQTSGNFKTKKQIVTFLSRSQQQQNQIGQNRIYHWDNDYLTKSIKWPCFIMTRPLYLNIHNPTLISSKTFDTIFGKIPNTQTPNKLNTKQLQELSNLVNLDIIFSSDNSKIKTKQL